MPRELLARGTVHGPGPTLAALVAEHLVDAQPPVLLAEGLPAVVADGVDHLEAIGALDPLLAILHPFAVPAPPAVGHDQSPLGTAHSRSFSSMMSVNWSQTLTTWSQPGRDQASRMAAGQSRSRSDRPRNLLFLNIGHDVLF